jgi:hypothetical protein
MLLELLAMSGSSPGCFSTPPTALLAILFHALALNGLAVRADTVRSAVVILAVK